MNRITKLLWEKADYCLRVSLYYTGLILQSRIIKPEEKEALEDMRQECKPENVFACKSKAYHWGPYFNEEEGINDGGSDGLTRWLYDYILKRFNINPLKGLNGDQMRPYFAVLYATGDYERAKKIWNGFKLRLTMFPSLMESFVFKPQTLYLLFKTLKRKNWLIYPLYWISAIFFYFAVKRNLKQPISEGTTNKITLLPTMKLARYKMPSDEYIIEVYETYFHSGIDGKLIRDSIITGLIGEDNYKKYLERKFNAK